MSTPSERVAARFCVESGGIDFAPLGHHIALDLDDRCTVLVGRNAAGKSLILEGLYRGEKGAVLAPGAGRNSGPVQQFTMTLRFETGDRLRYSYQRPTTKDPDAQDGDDRPAPNYSEKCEWIGQDPEIVWDLTRGQGTLRGGTRLVIADSAVTALSTVDDPVPEARLLERLFVLTKLVAAGVPRDRPQRQEYFARRNRPLPTYDRRIGRLATTITRWHGDFPKLFEELVELARRIGVLSSLDVQTYRPEHRQSEDELIDILVDGVNVGLLSDGTLRVLETLVAVLTAPLLFLEEPETGIHPGLLTKLLAVLESYSADRQFVISTHSPLLVSWAKPGQLRVVERSANGTAIHPLRQDQIRTACKYLEDSNLGEFVYGGGADNV